MRYRIPPRPSERNHRIYTEVRIRRRTQADVAAEFGISQPRVSAIIRQVLRWIASAVPREFGSGIEAKFLADYEYLQQVELAQQLALQIFQQTAGPQVEIKTVRRDGVETVVERCSRHGKPDARFLQSFTEMAEKRCNIRKEMADYVYIVQDVLEKDPLWEEDSAVIELEERIRQAKTSHKRRQKEGHPSDVPLPTDTPAERERTMRRKWRTRQMGDTAETLFPEEWRKVFDDDTANVGWTADPNNPEERATPVYAPAPYRGLTRPPRPGESIRIGHYVHELDNPPKDWKKTDENPS